MGTRYEELYTTNLPSLVAGNWGGLLHSRLCSGNPSGTPPPTYITNWDIHPFSLMGTYHETNLRFARQTCFFEASRTSENLICAKTFCARIVSDCNPDSGTSKFLLCLLALLERILSLKVNDGNLISCSAKTFSQNSALMTRFVA